jgi:ribosomal protein S18 acetylase RimI-like enzyme
MNEALALREVEIRTFDVAKAIHAVQMAAYAQEAALLGLTTLPPMRVTVPELQSSPNRFQAAFKGETLVGAISTLEKPELDSLLIDSLVVHPGHQRLGVASLLLRHCLQDTRALSIRVSTGAGNEPAIALYQKHGFAVYRLWRIEAESLDLVTLRLQRSPPKAG